MSNINTTRAREIVRVWARRSGLDAADRGAIPESVRQAYVDAHAGDRLAPVLEREPHAFQVMCPLCANEHEHSKELGWRVAHCTNPLTDTTDGYEVVEIVRA